MIDEIIEYYSEEEFLTADGLNDAIIGLDENSVKKCIEIFTAQGMDEIDAIEYFEFNVKGAYVGEQTPIWCEDNF